MMRANPSLHEGAFAILRKVARNGARVIDVGSGQGAFAARLRDEGFQVTAVDKDPSDFKATGIEFVEIDFDRPDQVNAFKRDHSTLYDIAVGMEVIEHVENPWEYCRFLLSLVKPGGLVLLTTPNAESALSRIELLCTGTFSHFGPSDVIQSGHINPLTFHELHLIADGVGAETLVATAICPLPWLIISRRPLVVLRSLMAALVRIFAGRNARGDVICFVLRKPK
jgi:2-polyprenyl-3-methyl-5-hydroxy-6-metoxy-1,4-benzoquinol methylase